MPRCKFMHNLSCEQVSDRIIELEDENDKLREVLESCVVLLTDHQFLHLPELRDETFKAMRELGVEADDE